MFRRVTDVHASALATALVCPRQKLVLWLVTLVLVDIASASAATRVCPILQLLLKLNGLWVGSSRGSVVSWLWEFRVVAGPSLPKKCCRSGPPKTATVDVTCRNCVEVHGGWTGRECRVRCIRGLGRGLLSFHRSAFLVPPNWSRNALRTIPAGRNRNAYSLGS